VLQTNKVDAELGSSVINLRPVKLIKLRVESHQFAASALVFN